MHREGQCPPAPSNPGMANEATGDAEPFVRLARRFLGPSLTGAAAGASLTGTSVGAVGAVGTA